LILLITGITDIKLDGAPVEFTDFTGHVFLPDECFLMFGFKILRDSFYCGIADIKALLFEIIVFIVYLKYQLLQRAILKVA